MNSIFGRSKSKHRKAGVGNLKDRIGNPTPVDTIKINGSFIDLKVSPQDSRSPSQDPPISQLPVVNQAQSEERKGPVGDDTHYNQRHYQTNHPPRPSPSESNTNISDFDFGDYFRGNSGSNGQHTHETERNQEESYQSQPRPYSPHTTRLNFSRPAVSPTPDDVKSITASFSSVSSASPSDPTTSIRNQDSTNLKITPLTGASTTTAGYSIAQYIPYSPAVASSQPWGRPVQRVGERSLQTEIVVQEQELQGRGRTIDRSTPTQRQRSSSSAYSSTTSVSGPQRIPPYQPQPEQQQRRRPERLNTEPAKALQQVETAKYFESDTVPEDPVSPLLPSPRRGSNGTRQPSPELSPEFGPTSSPELLDLNLNKDDSRELGSLDLSFIDFSIPSPAMGTKNHLRKPVISAPQSPELQKPLAHLGPLQPVQRELDYDEIPAPPPPPGEKDTSTIPKRSLSRKVSTKLRTLVGAGARPRDVSGANASATSPVTGRQRQNSRGGLNKYAISCPIPILEEQQADLEVDGIMARFDIERPRPTRRVEEIQDKVEDWNYNPSAASSASSVSLHPSDNATTPAESESLGGNPGLSSHRSSTRSSQRNATPDSPVTPADDGCLYSFTTLRGHVSVGDTTKSDMTVRQRDYHSPSVLTKHSEEVPMFLDTTVEGNGTVPSFTHEPPTPEPHQTTFSRSLPVLENFYKKSGSKKAEEELLQPGASPKPSRDSSGSIDSSTSSIFARPSPTISTAPTSVASSPLFPPSTLAKRSPTVRKPPFGPGSPRMLLRSATMSSRQMGGVPFKPLKPSMAGPIPEDGPTQAVSYGDPQKDTGSPISPHDRPGSAFSFVQEDISPIHPSDSVSQMGSRGQASPLGPAARSDSPNTFDVDRSLPPKPQLREAKSHSNIRPSTTSRTQNDRVTALSRLGTDPPPRPSTATPGRGSLRLNTEVAPSVSVAPSSAVESGSGAQGLHPPAIKRTRSVGEGLRRAFSRRTPERPRMPPTTPSLTERNPALLGSSESGATSPVTEVSGPLGCGTSSETSMARWNTAIRAAQVSSALERARSQSGSRLSPASLASPVPSTNPNRTSIILKAQPLTAEDRRGMQHAPGTLFIRTCEEGEDGISKCKEHRMKPRKGGVMQTCAFCEKGPFANMWVCLDEGPTAEEKERANPQTDKATGGEKGGVGNMGEREATGGRCRFVVCRMCCNEKVQEGSAEIF